MNNNELEKAEGTKKFHRYTKEEAAPAEPKRKKGMLIAILAAVGVLAVGCVIFFAINVNMGSKNFSITDSKVNLRNTGITSTEGLDRLLAPVSIDLRGNNVPPEEVKALMEKFPDCKILWSVYVGGNYIDCDKQNIAVSGMTLEEVPLLLNFANLKSVDAKGLDYEVVDAINKLGLGCEVEWDIGIGEDRFSPDAESITIGDAPAEDLANLTLFKTLKSVDAKKCKAYDALVEISSQMPECEIVWSVKIGDFDVLSNQEILNFERAVVEDPSVYDQAFENLKYLPKLKEVDMCGCGVPSEKMAEWRNKYPEKKFVWEISFGKSRAQYTIRTDIKVFSTLMGGLNLKYIGDQNMFREIFLYCTELRALDLGHNKITDISDIVNLKELQAVILMDNPIEDFTPLAQLPELRYAEINKTKLTDLSFAKDCHKLVHLDVSENNLRDFSALHDLEDIRYIIVNVTKINNEQAAALRENAPEGCKVSVFFSQYWNTRCSPLRSEYRKAFTNYKNIENFENWTDYTFVEGAKIQEPTWYRPPEFYSQKERDSANNFDN